MTKLFLHLQFRLKFNSIQNEVIKQEATKCTIYGMIVLQKKVRTEYALEIGPEIYRSVHPTIHKKFEKIKFINF